MKKRYSGVIACAALVFGSFAMHAQNLEEEGFTKTSPGIITLDTSEQVALGNSKAIFGQRLQLANDNQFQLKSQKTDDLGFVHQRFQQTYKGVPVEFALPVLHAKNGIVETMSGEYYDVKDLSVSAGLGKGAAFAKALSHTGAQSYMWQNAEASKELDYQKPEGELVILPLFDAGNVTMKLAYKYDIYATAPLSRGILYIDAQNGQALFYNAIIKHLESFGHEGIPEVGAMTEEAFCAIEESKDTYAMVSGTAATRYSGSRTIETALSGGNYILSDAGRKIYTRDAQNIAPVGNTYPYVTNYLQFTDNDNNWTTAEHSGNKDNAALDAHWGAAETHKYWADIHNRDSYDGNGAQIRSYVHVGSNYDNAFWNGAVMSYGDGSSNGNEGNGFFDALTSLDVAAHEIGHAVTSFTANLAYQRESGGLNEGYSDIWGAAVEHFAKGSGTDLNPTSEIWLIGDEIDRRSGSAALRSMSDPKSLGQPDTYGGSFWQNPNCGTPTQSNDYCGVHTNSGVLNHWFYLAVTGGSGTNDVGDVYNVTGIGMLKSAKISYRAINTYLSANSTFAQARTAMIQSAQDLYGADGQEEQTVTNAMYAVNVGDAYIVTGPPVCSSTVSSFPYTEGFENTLGQWSQGSGDDFDWAVQNGGTPSTGTGPSAAAAGTYYVYAETSNPNNPSKTTILNSPCFNLSGVNAPEATFQYQMTGTAVGNVKLEVRQDGASTWSQGWTKAGDQGAAWISETVNLAAYAGDTIQLRFVATSGTSWSGDIAIDDFGLNGTVAPDTEAPSNPTSLTAGGPTDTTVDLSWNASSDNVGVTGYDIYQGTTNLGEATGTTAQITGLTAGTFYSFRVRAKDAAGNISGYSNTASATTTGGGTSGGCTGGVGTFPYGESFEANLGLWSQAGGDDLNWTRDSGGTPSSGTGPTTGSDGSFYLFVEASGNGTGYPSKRAILNSPCFDLSGETEATFTFNYHANGTGTMGSIALEASSDDGSSWTSVWSESAHQGTAWQTQSVDLAAYLGGSVQLRFNRLTGTTWQSDVAIDNTRLTAGSGGGSQDPPTGYCASNGNNTSDEYIQRVQIGSINNVTGASAGGYGDFTSLSTNSSASNSITITPAWTGTVYSEGYAVFVDWNRDGDFTDAGETVYTRAASTATSVTGTFSTPAGASNGPTRMRVSMKYNGIPTACESFQYGEVEDYIVNIGGSSTATFAGPSTDTTASTGVETAFDFSIYPNPVTRGQLNVNVLGVDAQKFTIYNMLGQVVHAGAFNSTLDVSKLDSGVYMIEIQVGNATMSKRFIKQ
jgi:Zn-dependent metalloprotease